MKKGLLIILSGPSGVGKGTVRRYIMDNFNLRLTYSISMTTRKPRDKEVDGVDYYFVSKEEFEQRIKDGKFLEYASFIGNYYGTPLDKIEEKISQGKEVVLEIEVNGALQVKEKVKDAIMIFLVPPSKEDLFKRLRSRGTESEEIIEQRVKKASDEFKMAYYYDYIVVNDDVDNAADRIMAIIRAEHAKTMRSIYKYKKLMEEE